MSTRPPKADPVSRQVGITARALRLHRQLSQTTLAAALGWHRTVLTEIELGQRRVLVGELVALAAALDATPADLLAPGADRRLLLQARASDLREQAAALQREADALEP